ncbi:hypothetical protein FK498_06965 [Elioraea sp. Yellowstone]|jgi:hypothetical protein|uniref:SspB family protein n=1 Tax=Elioraea sp. Yellowstone TaxID=2592070 RepID=UPI001151F936|nr:ClpXP protease specificity-enhancing factor SspB [Elioraea sp. Yellowstone]TQF79855.1 hypothetical protein FK498_06965 [Elioraea sp. Yellowstone]
MAGDEPGLKDSLLPYEAWIQESLRNVMRLALERTAREGLPGEHHFYLTFRTDHPAVRMPARLKAQYPHEMTVVLQHQFESLEVDAQGFAVTLFFGGVPAHLTVPWAAVTQFADPSVRFGLRFDAPGAEPGLDPGRPAAGPEEAEAEPAPPAEASQVVSLDAFRKRPPRN